MADIAPELLEKVQEAFAELLEKSKDVKKYAKMVADGEATYGIMDDYAVVLGDLLAKAYKKITSADLPEGHMYYNIADRVIRPTMEELHNIVIAEAMQVQKALNVKAGLGLAPVKVAVNQNRIQGILDRLTEAELFDDVRWILEEPIRNFAQNVVDDSVRANIDAHAKAGLFPILIRTAEPPALKSYYKTNGVKRWGPYQYVVPCDWCKALEGAYEYAEVSGSRGEEVYRRHENCRCHVEYYPGKGKYTENVWTKDWQEKNADEIQQRIDQVLAALNAE